MDFNSIFRNNGLWPPKEVVHFGLKVAIVAVPLFSQTAC